MLETLGPWPQTPNFMVINLEQIQLYSCALSFTALSRHINKTVPQIGEVQPQD
jgi:hypothetical protein